MEGNGNDNDIFKETLQNAIKIVQDTNTPSKQRQTSISDISFNNTIDALPLYDDDSELMTTLTNKIQNVFKDVPRTMKNNYQNYLFSLLSEYDYDHKKLEFTGNLTVNILDAFLNDLESIHDSIDGFQAAFDGKEEIVREFLRKYPQLKDKPGVWSTTLLYSAARNNHLDLVKYLIEEANCSVNAQNEQDFERASGAETVTDPHYKVNPKYGSTALHAACFNRRLQIVEYLIEHGADCYIKNQAEETPISNIENAANIRKYFESILISSYSDKIKAPLPEKAIIEGEQSLKEDCVWEYKPFTSNTWSPFKTDDLLKQLNDSLKIDINQRFNPEIHIEMSSNFYTVSMIKFLRHGGKQDENEDFAWIRCRGSSILNFDCYSLWQIFLTKHPQANSKSVPSLQVFNLPIQNDPSFEIQLNTWYNCSAQTNSLLDKATNNRRRFLQIQIDHVSNNELKIDMKTFSVNNNDGTIEGFIRWIPKIISKNEDNKIQLKHIDNFQILANVEITLLTTQHLKILPITSDTLVDDEEEMYMNNDDDDRDEDLAGENDQIISSNISQSSLEPIPNDNDQLESLINEQPSVTDINRDDYYKNTTSSQDISHIDIPNSSIESEIRNLIDEEQKKVNEQDEVSVDREQMHKTLLASAKNEIYALRIAQEEKQQQWLKKQAELNEKYEQEKQEYEKQSNESKEKLTKLNDELKKIQEQNDKINLIEKSIKTRQYTNIEKQFMHDFITPEFHEFLDYIKTNVDNVDEYFRNRIPRITFKQTEDTYILTVIGFEKHHTIFENALRRLLNLSKSKQLAQEYYQRCLNRTKRILVTILWNVQSKTNVWKHYIHILLEYLNEKINEFIKRFNDIIRQKCRSLIKQTIVEQQSTNSETETPFYMMTNEFLTENSFINEIEYLRNKAFEQFIKENISFQRAKLDKFPTQKSIDVTKYFIDKIKAILESNKITKEIQLENFQIIPQLLQQIMIYYSCFKIQLPLFESSKDLLEKIQNHTVTTISTTTGSGKSTLLPALLAAEGYDKIIVTQPRRLPCKMISERVNHTIETDIGKSSYELSGWAVSGDSSDDNRTSKILYLTDGLLKEQLLYDKHFITNNIQVNKSIVFFIDEVHERSVNIDLCLALLARLLENSKPDFISKIKLIISSATLDETVPKLFSNMKNITFTRFIALEIGFRYKIRDVEQKKQNILKIVQELYKKRERDDQILCFVNSVTEVHQCCRLLSQLTQGTIIAYPLVQSQSAKTQEKYIKQGSVFFSTTVAETSLTFPSLKYVIDTGMVNIPIYNPESKRTILQQVRAAESTIKQRRGRLGRTRPGEYHYSYTFQVDEKPFPDPHILLSDLTNIEFSLRKSPIKNGLNYLQRYLPDKIKQNTIQAITTELIKLGILMPSSPDQFTTEGESLAKLPDFGSLAMAKSVLSALDKYHCGRDLICLSAILSVLNTTSILKDIPQKMKSADGDFMTLLNIMNKILTVKQSVLHLKFDLQCACEQNGLKNIAHIIHQAMRRYDNLEKAFNQSHDYRRKAQIRSENWKSIAKSLLSGYGDNVFVSMKDLYGKIHLFIRYNDENDRAMLDLQSTLARPISEAPVSVVLARDIRYGSAIRSIALLSFVGELKPTWIDFNIERTIELTEQEKQHLNGKNTWTRIKSTLSHGFNQIRNQPSVSFNGTIGTVINDEFHLRNQMITTFKFHLKNNCKPNTAAHENLSKNLESLTKMIYIFNPMKWRWQAQKQVKITINDNPAMKTCDIIVEGRDSENKNVEKEFDSFLGWLQRTAVIRHPNEGVLPRLLRPAVRKRYPNIEKRIMSITDSQRTMVDLYNGVKGIDATRETRMEVVAWIAVCKFHCKLEGGFVRDWVVGGYQFCPKDLIKNPKSWIRYETNNQGQQIPYLHEQIIPADLDCHLSVYHYFDIDKFLDELYKFNIICRVFREEWRYILLIDENEPTGPFTMDLIEPQVALTHDRIDFDVSNLSLEKDFPREIGMRIDITENPYEIQLETIVENIMNTRYQILRPIDTYVDRRIQKMTLRQWKQHGEAMDYIPRPHFKRYSMLVPLPSSSTLFKEVSQIMNKIGSIQILCIDEIKNPLLEYLYEGMKKIIAKQCKTQGYDPNERKLFHGTTGDGIRGIVEDGYDDRFFKKSGAWGHGAYFADDPTKSHNYNDPGYNQPRIMFYNKVILGIVSTMAETDDTLASAPEGCHSVKGTKFKFAEYIVYRYAQALPYLKITYK